MSEIITVGVDLAKNVFQIHGAHADGSVAIRRQVRRTRFWGCLRSCRLV